MVVSCGDGDGDGGGGGGGGSGRRPWSTVPARVPGLGGLAVEESGGAPAPADGIEAAAGQRYDAMPAGLVAPASRQDMDMDRASKVDAGAKKFFSGPPISASVACMVCVCLLLIVAASSAPVPVGALPRQGKAAARPPAGWTSRRIGEIDTLSSPGITDSTTAPPPPPPAPYKTQEQESNNGGWTWWRMVPIGFVALVFIFFFVVAVLYWYEQRKRARRPLLRGGSQRGCSLRRLQGGSAGMPPTPATNSSDHHRHEAELDLSESEQESEPESKAAQCRSRLDDAQSSAQIAAVSLESFSSAACRQIMQCSPPPPPPSSRALQHPNPSTSGGKVYGDIKEEW